MVDTIHLTYSPVSECWTASNTGLSGSGPTPGAALRALGDEYEEWYGPDEIEAMEEIARGAV